MLAEWLFHPIPWAFVAFVNLARYRRGLPLQNLVALFLLSSLTALVAGSICLKLGWLHLGPSAGTVLSQAASAGTLILAWTVFSLSARPTARWIVRRGHPAGSPAHAPGRKPSRGLLVLGVAVLITACFPFLLARHLSRPLTLSWALIPLFLVVALVDQVLCFPWRINKRDGSIL
jgi:hypothetical protein